MREKEVFVSGISSEEYQFFACLSALTQHFINIQALEQSYNGGHPRTAQGAVIT